jgi:multiple sugar transport system permease protein
MASITAPAGRAGRPRSAFAEEKVSGWVSISPWVVGFLIFTAGPIIASLYFSFTSYDVIRSPRWVGLENYVDIFTTDRFFKKSLFNSFVYTILYVPAHVATALGVALLLNQARQAAGIFRTLFYLPSMTPAVATAILWLWILNPNDGLVNRVLRFLHLPAPLWTIDPFWMKPSIVIMSCWHLGGAMLIFLAGLKNIPRELYEAAALDGANAWQRFRNVTLPMLSSVTFFIATMGLISALQVFTQGYVMFDESGGPQNAALFYIMHLFREAFRYLHIGYASALAWLLFIVIAGLTAIQFYLSKKWVYYETDR